MFEYDVHACSYNCVYSLFGGRQFVFKIEKRKSEIKNKKRRLIEWKKVLKLIKTTHKHGHNEQDLEAALFVAKYHRNLKVKLKLGRKKI